MTQNNNIPTGYKDSAVGIVPKDWKVYDFRDIASISKEKYTPSDSSCMPCMPCVELEHISQGDGVLLGSTEARLQKSTKNVFKKGCVLFGKLRPYLRKYLHVDFDGVCSSEIWVLSANENICSNKYLYRLVSSDKYIQCANVSIGSKMPRADWNFVSITPFPVPPMEEQRKIAEILGVWDEAIEKQNRLIERLEVRKRALMQRLLTGRVRLSGFTTPWQKNKLSEAGIFLFTNTLSREKLNDNDGYIQNIHYGDILVKYSSIVDAQLTAIPYINNGVDISSDYLENGDIVFSDTAEDSIVGKAIEISNIADNKIVAGLHTMLFRPNKGCYAKHYLGYYINSDAYRKQLAPLIQGIKVCSISKKAISQTIIETPSLPEQKAIAEVLTAADNEIATHRKKLAALRLQKRGLMQQLLTGKTRVKI